MDKKFFIAGKDFLTRKYRLWIGRLKWEALKAIPKNWVGEKVDLSKEITFGITTYVRRYERYLVKLLEKLHDLFPEVRVILAVNGFYDQNEQQPYLEKIKKDWQHLSNALFIMHRFPKGLAQLWNEIMVSSTTPYTVILNDDLEIVNPFRAWAERRPWRDTPVLAINGTWSHFVIQRDCYDQVGPFDQDFPGIGFEDFDYEARMLLLHLRTQNSFCRYLRHHKEFPPETSFKNMSPTLWGKYTTSNLDYFRKKWEETDSSEEGLFFVEPLKKHIRPKKGFPLFHYRPTLAEMHSEGPLFLTDLSQ